MGNLPTASTKSLLLGFALSLMTGCDRENINSVASTKDEESRKEWLVVSADPDMLASAREKAKKQEAKEYSDFFKGLTRSTYLDPETAAMIDKRRDEVVKRLNQLAASTMAKNQGIGAALVLCRLKEPSGLVRVKEVLRTGSNEQKTRVLGSLGMVFAPRTSEDFRTYRDFVLGDSELIDLVWRQMNDPKADVVYAAVQLGGTLKIPGLSDHIIKILEKSSELDRGRLVYWLSQGELTEQIFEFAMSDGERARIATDDHWGSSLYEAFAKSKNEAWSRPAREILFIKLLASPEKTKGSYTGGRIGMIDTVAETATKDDLPRIKKLAKREQGYYATSLLAGWIRLDPKGGRKVLLQWLAQPDRRDIAIDAAARVYAKTSDQEIVEALRKNSSDLNARELYSACHALRTLGGADADELLTSLIPRLPAAQQAFFKRDAVEVSIDELLAALDSSGVLPPDLMSKTTARVRGKRVAPADATAAENVVPSTSSATANEDEEEDQPSGLFEVLIAAECALMFDAETDHVPCRHDQLLKDFASSSRGLFTPEAAAEEWLRKKSTDDDAPYRVQFIHHGHLYDAELRNQGDWYDVERLTQMINRALKDAEVSERFVALASEGQMAMFIFADPSRLAPLAEKFHLSLSDDVGEATKKGLEFERAVKEQLGDE